MSNKIINKVILDEYQKEIVESTEPRIIVEAGAGSGKALLNGSKVVTPEGYKNIEDLKINDEIFGSDGNIYNVCGIYPQGKKQIYEVTFSDGTIIKCSKDHLWAFQTSSMRKHNNYNYRVDTLENIKIKYPLFKNNKKNYKRKNIYIPLTSPLKFKKERLPIKPYTLGALIGNGYLRGRGKTCLFSSNDNIVLDRVSKELSEINYELVYNGKYDYRLRQINRKKESILIDILEKLKLDNIHSWNKFIPEIYLFSDIDDRLSLLQGLIDTDGYFKTGMYEYSTTSSQLAEDVKFLAQSLGLTAKISIKENPEYTHNNEKRIGKRCYRVYIKTSKEIPYIHYSENKGEKIYNFQTYARKSIIDIRETNEYGEMTCIKTTSPDELFLTDNFTVTHNTRILIERIKRLLKNGIEPQNIIAITFTNMAAEEMKERMKDIPNSGDCFIGTIHSFANKIFKNSGKQYRIYTEEIENQFMENLIMLYAKHLTFDRFLKIKDLKKQNELGIINDIQFDSLILPSERFEMNKLMGKSIDEYYKDTIYTLCKKANVITFDELLEKTTEYFKEINGHVQYLFVDEFQDIGPLENKFFEALNAENYFYVGDEKQCQPEGTKITMGDGSIKNIEDIKVGDTVLSYNLSEGYYSFDSRRGKGKKILEISRHYEKELVEIETENKFKSKYTKNHRCLAKIHYDGNENKSVVYIMQNQKGQYRVGSTKLFTFDGRNFGLRARMNTEKAINGWILDVYDNQSEAWLAEQICAYKFGIPQTTWTYKNVRYNDDDIDNLYEKLGDLTLKVKICLEYFGKDINYPIFTKNVNKHFSKKHLTEVRACNLIPEVMDIAVPYKDENNRFKNKYFQIKKINIIENNKMVYGLKVEKNETYVADNILTHNSLYAFKGSDVKYFTNLIDSSEWKTYFLKNNYRSGKKIIDIATVVIKQASGIINYENICKSNNAGEVIVDVKTNLDSYLNKITNFKDWFILVRTNKEIYEMEQKLNYLNIPFTTFKRSELDLAKMRERLEENNVKLLTVHSSKGLESKNVLLYGNFPVRQKPYLINSDERKVMYVGCTRAIDKLIILN